MQRVSIDDVEAQSPVDDLDARELSDPLGTTDVAINHYRVGPGEGLPGGLHAHADQEEVFVVLAGEATFETLDGEVTVREGEAVRFAPGEFQSGWNPAGGDLAMLALGAPAGTEDVRLPANCPDCGHDDLRIESGDDGPRFECPDCGAVHVPAPCPECGHDDLRFTLDADGDGTVVACRGCGAEYDAPPLRD